MAISSTSIELFQDKLHKQTHTNTTTHNNNNNMKNYVSERTHRLEGWLSHKAHLDDFEKRKFVAPAGN
jgi:hypothetical protein